MKRVNHIFVWLSRSFYCRGFGIQSPTDYRFVRYVINEHWPYYAYQDLGTHDDWLTIKLGRLYFRLANELQPDTILDQVGMSSYLKSGCRKSRFVSDSREAQLALMTIGKEVVDAMERVPNHATIVVQGINKNRHCWEQLINSERATISFDLYYCGIILLDRAQSVKHYTINF